MNLHIHCDVTVSNGVNLVDPAGVGGMALTSEPVSRKCVRVCESLTKRGDMDFGSVALVATSVRPRRFPSCRAPGTSWRLHQIFCGTNRAAVAKSQWGRGFGGGVLSIHCGLFAGGAG